MRRIISSSRSDVAERLWGGRGALVRVWMALSWRGCLALNDDFPFTKPNPCWHIVEHFLDRELGRAMFFFSPP